MVISENNVEITIGYIPYCVEKIKSEDMLDTGVKRLTRYGKINRISALMRELLSSFNLFQIRLNDRILKTDTKRSILSRSNPDTNRWIIGFTKNVVTINVIRPIKREKLKTA